MDQRTVLRVMACAMAALELVMVFQTEFWVPALVMAALFGFLAWRLAPGRRWVLAGLSAAFLVELLPLAFFPREGVSDWVAQGLTAAFSVIGLVLAVNLLRTSRRVKVA